MPKIPRHHLYFRFNFIVTNNFNSMKILGKVIKSQSDSRLYKAIKLNNDLQCLIISDKDARKSSAALSVAVGSLKDPIEAQGLAHYL